MDQRSKAESSENSLLCASFLFFRCCHPRGEQPMTRRLAFVMASTHLFIGIVAWNVKKHSRFLVSSRVMLVKNSRSKLNCNTFSSSITSTNHDLKVRVKLWLCSCPSHSMWLCFFHQSQQSIQVTNSLRYSSVSQYTRSACLCNYMEVPFIARPR